MAIAYGLLANTLLHFFEAFHQICFLWFSIAKHSVRHRYVLISLSSDIILSFLYLVFCLSRLEVDVYMTYKKIQGIVIVPLSITLSLLLLRAWFSTIGPSCHQIFFESFL